MARKSKQPQIKGSKPAICPAGRPNCPICSGIATVTRPPSI